MREFKIRNLLPIFTRMDGTLGNVSGEFGIALLYLIGGVLFVVGGLILNKFLSPNRPNPEKLSTYECGEDPVGNARIQFNNRFYVAALIFLIFDVEIVFLFPWATVFADANLISMAPSWGWVALMEAGIFVVILLLGLAYVWVKGDLDWIKPKPQIPTSPAQVPEELYEEFNAQR
jgi:NADH-quinone oxidoreductase subunit A